ncbi:MAG: N-acetylmuramoyl-L-alanine amidase [Endomicrobium sp.]|jgi:N-acetylmuramoyl-L-alanine amidase|nr:N-acetylmuramoyl-L-alanine amidase [Endomicrobium sp.]
MLSPQNISIKINNKVFSKIKVYNDNKTYYFPAKMIAKIYNGHIIYKPKTSLTIYLNNIKIFILVNSNKIVFSGSTTEKMPFSAKIINNEIYIPYSFFSLKNFIKLTDTMITFNPKTSTLFIITSQNISSIDYTVNKCQTKITLKCEKALQYVILKKNTTKIVIKILNGHVNKEHNIILNDGILKSILCKNFYNNAIITINFSILPKCINIIPYRIHKINISISYLKKLTLNNKQKVYYLFAAGTKSYKPRQKTVNEKINKFHSASNYKKRHKIIVIDAGHGGKDPGAIGVTGTREKDINLLLAKEIKKLFERYTNYKIVLTRYDDVFISLIDRAKVANNKNAILFISLHCNSSTNSNAAGFEIYFLSYQNNNNEAVKTAIRKNTACKFAQNSKITSVNKILKSLSINKYINDSAILCNFIKNELKSKVKINLRGIKQGNFMILRYTNMPSIIIESAFLSNFKQEKKLNSKKFRNILAMAIYKGINNYCRYMEKNR